MIYLDYNATTPVDPRVLDAMIPTFTENFGNPSSTTHDTGMQAGDLVDDARDSVAAVIGMNMSDVIFTSGATEANNMVFRWMDEDDYEHRVLVGATEHKSVMESSMHMREFGVDVRKIPVLPNGTLNMRELDRLLTEGHTSMISVMAANSETGVIHPIKEVAEIANELGIILHCDATQAIGRIPFDATELGVDIVTFSGHKIYGPKGCGALVATREARRMLGSFIRGGGQENGMRSGTLNVPGIVGFGKACAMILEEKLSDIPRQKALRDDFERKITAAIPDITINGMNAKRLPNTSNIRIAGAMADAVIVNARNIEMATGSACSSNTMEPSHVLTAMGLDRTAADECIRISIGRQTTRDDIDVAVSEISQAAQFVRQMESVGMSESAS